MYEEFKHSFSFHCMGAAQKRLRKQKDQPRPSAIFPECDYTRAEKTERMTSLEDLNEWSMEVEHCEVVDLNEDEEETKMVIDLTLDDDDDDKVEEIKKVTDLTGINMDMLRDIIQDDNVLTRIIRFMPTEITPPDVIAMFRLVNDRRSDYFTVKGFASAGETYDVAWIEELTALPKKKQEEPTTFHATIYHQNVGRDALDEGPMMEEMNDQKFHDETGCTGCSYLPDLHPDFVQLLKWRSTVTDLVARKEPFLPDFNPTYHAWERFGVTLVHELDGKLRPINDTAYLIEKSWELPGEENVDVLPFNTFDQINGLQVPDDDDDDDE